MVYRLYLYQLLPSIIILDSKLSSQQRRQLLLTLKITIWLMISTTTDSYSFHKHAENIQPTWHTHWSPDLSTSKLTF